MAKQIWRPDTCGCVIEEDRPEGGGAKTFSKVIRKCAAHADVDDAELAGENKRKNQLHAFLANHPDFGQDVPTDRGTARALRPDVDVTFTWTGEGRDRVLRVAIRGSVPVTPTRRAALAAFIAGGP